LHTTVARNIGGDGSGIHVTADSGVVVANSILVSHTIGIYVDSGTSAWLEGTLWYENQLNTAGAGWISTGTVNVHGDPAFVDVDAGDYHIRTTSAARDAGVDIDVGDDMDDDPRPQGTGFDIGADEYVPPSAPNVGTFEPDGGSGRVGEWVDFTTTYTDPDDYGDIELALFFLGREETAATTGLAAAYYQPDDILWLRNGSGDTCLPGQPVTLTSHFTTLDCENSSVSGEGDTLTISWRVRPERCFIGDCGWNYAYEYVVDSAKMRDSGVVGWWMLEPVRGTAQDRSRPSLPTGVALGRLAAEAERQMPTMRYRLNRRR